MKSVIRFLSIPSLLLALQLPLMAEGEAPEPQPEAAAPASESDVAPAAAEGEATEEQPAAEEAEPLDQETLQDKYLNVYMLIEETEKIEKQGGKETARKNYEVALKQLNEFPPGWNPSLIGYRKKFCKDRIKALKGAKNEEPKKLSTTKDYAAPAEPTPTQPAATVE